MAKLEYSLIEHRSRETFEADVNEHLEEGWEPWGGVCVLRELHENVPTTYVQAMTRKIKKKKK